MSYLDIPRIHFGGKFFTDPSTVNNDPTHYIPENTTPSPWQCPNGQHRFQLRACRVKSVVGPEGDILSDPILGCAIESTDKPSAAKIADLDVYQQGVPTIFGMQIQITLPDDTKIVGTLDPAVLNQIWFNSVLPTRSWEDEDYVQDSFGGDMNACGWFQSVIRVNVADWPMTSSNVLQQLRHITLLENSQYLISIKFILDGYQNVPQDKEYQTGRIVGTLGPVFPNEPLYNPGQRWMLPRAFSKSDPWNMPSFNLCPFKVDRERKKLVLDLANSICREFAGGAPVDLGILTATVSTPDPVVAELGSVDYSEFTYNSHAHITEIDLEDGQLDLLDEGFLKLVSSRSDLGTPEVLSEADTGVQFSVEVRPIRMEGSPGTKATTRIYVSQNGSPYQGKELKVLIESVHGDTPGATVPPNNPGNTPGAEDVLSVEVSPSDEQGYATVTLTVKKDPGMRTPELDGQLYFVIVYDPDLPHPDWSKIPPRQDHLISCLVWSEYPVNEKPSWEIVRGLLAPYMKLFPYMKDQIDLTDEHTFSVFTINPPWSHMYGDIPPGPLGIQSGAIPFYLTRDFEDPRFMPVTRDLSPSRIMTILHYIKNLQTPSA